MTYEELVGQKLVWGIEGTRATAEVVKLFRGTHAGGLILFRRNIESKEGVRRLISDLEEGLGRRLLVMMDHEGGRVIHLGEGVTIFPDAYAAGFAGKPEWVKEQGKIEAAELLPLGFDLNLAPVLDVLGKAWNPAIGTRSYGEDAGLVAQLGAARIEGMQSQGLSACAKHYPGLGAAEFDPHRDLPVIQKNWKAMKECDLVPFKKAIEAGVDSVMSSHPVYPELDPGRVPATFSRKMIQDSLRLEFGFEGLILTDDLKMGAISSAINRGGLDSLREAAPLAAQAGHDLLLVCSDPKAQRKTFESLTHAYQKKELKTAELEASVERIQKLKEKRSKRFSRSRSSPDLSLGYGESSEEKFGPNGRELARQIARGGARVLGSGKGLLPLSPAYTHQQSLLFLFPDLSPVSAHFFIEPELLNPKDFLKKIFEPYGIPVKSAEVIPLDPGSLQRNQIKALARDQDLVFFFVSDAHYFRGTRELLKDLQRSVKKLVAVLLREPRDFDWIEPRTACVTACGFRVSQIEAAVEKLFSPA